jgi:hypothetical protein
MIVVLLVSGYVGVCFAHIEYDLGTPNVPLAEVEPQIPNDEDGMASRAGRMTAYAIISFIFVWIAVKYLKWRKRVGKPPHLEP